MKPHHRIFEYETADEIGGTPQPASGAKDQKLDVIRKPFVLIDCKCPRSENSASWRISGKDWEIAEGHARRVGLTPAMAGKLLNVNLCAMKTTDLAAYFDEIEQQQEQIRELRKQVRRLKAALKEAREEGMHLIKTRMVP